MTPIPRIGPIPETPIPRIAPLPDAPLPRVGPTPGPGPAPLPPPVPFTGPLPGPQPAPQPDVTPQPSPQTETDEEKKKKKGCGIKRLPFTVVQHEDGPLGQGKRVRASPLTRCPPVEGPGTLPAPWIYKAQFDCLAQKGQGDFWVRMHLLHGKTTNAPVRNLHGPGDKMWNLIIGDKWVNGQMYGDVETKVIPRLYDYDAVLWYETTVDDYIAGNEYFVRKFTVRYGSYDTETGKEGPELDKWVYANTKYPPSCPPSLSGGTPAAAAGAGAATPDGAVPAFESTFQVCYRLLTTRTFKVDSGGVTVNLTGAWARRFADASTDCPTDAYEVTLHKKGLIFDDDFPAATVPIGAQSVSWSPLTPGSYYFTIEAPGHSPLCCLQGDIAVSTFYAPLPGPVSPNWA